MDFGEVLRNCVFGAAGFVRDLDDVAAQEDMIRANLPVLAQFSSWAIATNFGPDADHEVRAANAELWRSYLPDCAVIDSPLNRGHAIGSVDLDVLLIEHCRELGHRLLCKAAFDIRLREDVLHIPVSDAQFYFINALSFDALAKRGFDRVPFTDGFFFPQTTFFVVDVAVLGRLADPDFLDRSWALAQRLPDNEGRLWEYAPRWSCELILRDAVVRGGLSRCDLVSPKQWERVVDQIITGRVTDCSLKGIDINGICHVDRTWRGREIVEIAS